MSESKITGTPVKDRWLSLPASPPDSIFFLANKAKAAKPPKANLIIGAYRDKEGRPYPLPVVREAERILLKKRMNYEYLPIAGFEPFINEALKLLYGESISLKQVVGVQSLSGTGAVSLGAFFLARVFDRERTPVYFSNPTWPNHYPIFATAGWKNLRAYRYFDAKSGGLDFEGMKKDIQAAPTEAVFVLHQCAHNPTGVDPTEAQWDELAELFTKTGHQVFFDSAYQGYASGDLDKDAYAARAFAKRGIPIVCAQSFSKNMGLYNERVGTFSVVLQDASHAAAVKSNLENIIRPLYSNAPAHGARLVHIILGDLKLRKRWIVELRQMSNRIKAMRKLVHAELVRLQTPGRWDHIEKQIGMFSFLGLNKAQCEYCLEHNVFITLTGRANMAALTNVTAIMLARTINDAVRQQSKL